MSCREAPEWYFTPSRTLSSTVFHGKIDFVYCWNTNIISERGPAIGSPLRLTVPAVGSESPAMMCSNVDLPHPDGPIRAMNSPWPTEKLMSRNAARPCDVNRFARPSIRRVSDIGAVETALLVGKAIASGLLKRYAIGNVECAGAIATRRTMGMALQRHIPSMMPNCCLRTASSCEFVRRGSVSAKFLICGMSGYGTRQAATSRLTPTKSASPQSGRRPTRRACLLSTVESGHPIYVANECTSLLAATPGV